MELIIIINYNYINYYLFCFYNKFSFIYDIYENVVFLVSIYNKTDKYIKRITKN